MRPMAIFLVNQPWNKTGFIIMLNIQTLRVETKEYLLSENGQQAPLSLLKFHFPLESRKL